jgi:hypothetical protein
LFAFLFHITNTANQLFPPHIDTNNSSLHKKKLRYFKSVLLQLFQLLLLTTTTTTTTTTTMPLLSISKAAVIDNCRFNAMFCRPSTKQGGGRIATSSEGFAIIQKQIHAEGDAINVIRYTNYFGIDCLNGRILPGLPIHRKENSKEVFFKTSSTTTRGIRHKAPYALKFKTLEHPDEFEMWWLLKNGSIASWKKEDTWKKSGSNSLVINNPPLQETTNASSHADRPKRKAAPMIDGPFYPLRKQVKDVDSSLNLVCAKGGGDIKNGNNENAPALWYGRNDDDGIADPSVVEPNESVNVKVSDKVKSFVAYSGLKSIAEDSINNLNEEDVIDLNGDNSKDLKDDNGSSSDDNSSSSDDDDSSNDSSGEKIIIDDEDAPQSQNWMTAFASY